MEQIQLVQDAVRGDPAAFGKLYELYAVELFRYACYVLGSREAAEDAVQDAVLSAYRQVTSLRNVDAFKPWLFKILSVTCRKYIAQKKQAQGNVEFTEQTAGASGYFPDVAAGLSPELTLALARLSEEERAIVILSTLYGYKSREIAEILDLNAGTVRSKLSRALEKMRTMMEQEESQ